MGALALAALVAACLVAGVRAGGEGVAVSVATDFGHCFAAAEAELTALRAEALVAVIADPQLGLQAAAASHLRSVVELQAASAAGGGGDALPGLQATVFLVQSDEFTAGAAAFSGGANDTSAEGAYTRQVLLAYGLVLGAYPDPEQLVAAGSINTALGERVGVDYPLGFSRAPDGGVLVTGIGAYSSAGAPPSATARIVGQVVVSPRGGGPEPASCAALAAGLAAPPELFHSVVYVLDRLPLPADTLGQIFPPGSITGNLLVQLGALAAATADTPTSGCTEYGAAVSAAPGTGLLLWTARLGGDVAFTEAPHLPATALAARDDALSGQPLGSGGAPQISLDIVLYNMVPNALCPRELANTGAINSALGEVLGRSLPLSFAWAPGEAAVVASGGGPGGPATLSAAGPTLRACGMWLYAAAGAPLAPPPGAANGSVGAADVEAWAARARRAAQRRMACVPPAFPGGVPAGVAAFPVLAGAYDVPAGSGDGSLSAGAIVGIAVGCAAALAAAAALVWRRRRDGTGAATGAKAAAVDDSAAGTGSSDGTGSGEARPPGVAGPLAAGPAFAAAEADPANWLALSRRVDPAAAAGGARFMGLSAADWAALDPGEILLARGAGGAPEVLGEGIYGRVLRGLRNGVAPVACKFVTAGDAPALLAEVAALKLCADPHVVQVFGAALHGSELVLVMELMPGGSLADKIYSAGGWGWYGAGRRAALQIAAALVHLHSRGLVHFDVKPQNVLLTADGTAKLGDLGISRFVTHRSALADAGESNRVAAHGTFNFASPEAILGQRCSVQTDVYSFGVLLWEIVCQRPSRRGRMSPPRVPEECPAEVAALIERCMAIDPAARPTSREVYEVLAAALGGAGPLADAV